MKSFLFFNFVIKIFIWLYFWTLFSDWFKNQNFVLITILLKFIFKFCPIIELLTGDIFFFLIW